MPLRPPPQSLTEPKRKHSTPGLLSPRKHGLRPAVDPRSSLGPSLGSIQSSSLFSPLHPPPTPGWERENVGTFSCSGTKGRCPQAPRFPASPGQMTRPPPFPLALSLYVNQTPQGSSGTHSDISDQAGSTSRPPAAANTPSSVQCAVTSSDTQQPCALEGACAGPRGAREGAIPMHNPSPMLGLVQLASSLDVVSGPPWQLWGPMQPFLSDMPRDVTVTVCL